MQDPRLNSIHLTAGRREQFRAARSGLLESCGTATIAGERPAPLTGEQHTAIFEGDKRVSATIRYVLVEKDAVYPLKTGINTVGRMPDNDIAILDGSVSRRHCAIVVHSSHVCEVHDTASKNGTFVNGERITAPTQLRPGDELRLCDRRLVFLADEPDGPDRDDGHQTIVE